MFGVPLKMCLASWPAGNLEFPTLWFAFPRHLPGVFLHMEDFYPCNFLKMTHDDFWKPRDLKRDHSDSSEKALGPGNNTVSKNMDNQRFGAQPSTEALSLQRFAITTYYFYCKE